MTGPGIFIAVLFGLFFVSGTWALFQILGRRDRTRAAHAVRATPIPQPASEGTVYGMTPGSRYRVMKSFTDCYGGSFQEGEILQFKERHFLPYHGGHTIIFAERSLYLQEDESREILGSFSEYLAQVTE
jgi:hypothetical protein